MFQNWGVDGYRPVTHWTSKLRVRAGLPPAPRVTEDMSPFTVDGLRASQGMTELLRRLGLAVDDHFDGWGHPTYHFEVAISTKTWGSPFVWSSSQLRRVSYTPSHRAPCLWPVSRLFLLLVPENRN